MGEVLLGPSTFRLVREAGHARPAPRVLLGADEAVDLAPAQPDRRLRQFRVDSGRRSLAGTTSSAPRHGVRSGNSRRRACKLVVVVGEPGIGKSRLTVELSSRLADEATILIGHCPQCGEECDLVAGCRGAPGGAR